MAKESRKYKGQKMLMRRVRKERRARMRTVKDNYREEGYKG